MKCDELKPYLVGYERQYYVYDATSVLCKASRKNGKKEKLEKLYFNGTMDDYKRLMGAEYRPIDEGKQLDIFEGVA